MGSLYADASSYMPRHEQRTSRNGQLQRVTVGGTQKERDDQADRPAQTEHGGRDRTMTAKSWAQIFGGSRTLKTLISGLPRCSTTFPKRKGCSATAVTTPTGSAMLSNRTISDPAFLGEIRLAPTKYNRGHISAAVEIMFGRGGQFPPLPIQL